MIVHDYDQSETSKGLIYIYIELCANGCTFGAVRCCLSAAADQTPSYPPVQFGSKKQGAGKEKKSVDGILQRGKRATHC